MVKIACMAILLLLPFVSGAQYIDLNGGFNKVQGVMDDPVPNIGRRGIDLDLEAGALSGNYSVFFFYGRFEQGRYSDYGIGSEYYLAKGDWYDIAIGAAPTMIIRRKLRSLESSKLSNCGFLGWMTRLSGVFWMYRKIGISGKLAYQRRPDLDIHGVMEASIGIRVKLSEYK